MDESREEWKVCHVNAYQLSLLEHQFTPWSIRSRQISAHRGMVWSHFVWAWRDRISRRPRQPYWNQKEI